MKVIKSNLDSLTCSLRFASAQIVPPIVIKTLTKSIESELHLESKTEVGFTFLCSFTDAQNWI